MNKEELKALVAELLGQMEPPVKGADYRNTAPEPEKKATKFADGDFVPDVTALDLRKLYLVEDPEKGAQYKKMKEKTRIQLLIQI